MARMSREFSLVLLGAGILSAGYFLWPEENLEARANQQAAQQVGGSESTGRRGHGGMLIFLHTSRWGGRGASPAKANVGRGGFGHTGASISASSCSPRDQATTPKRSRICSNSSPSSRSCSRWCARERSSAAF